VGIDIYEEEPSNHNVFVGGQVVPGVVGAIATP